MPYIRTFSPFPVQRLPSPAEMGNHSRLYTAGNMVYRKTVHIKWLIPYPGREAACTVLKSRQNAPILRCFAECVSIPGKYQNVIQPAFRANIRAPRTICPAAGKLSPAPVARKRAHNAPCCIFRPAGNIETHPAPPGAVCEQIAPILGAAPAARPAVHPAPLPGSSALYTPKMHNMRKPCYVNPYPPKRKPGHYAPAFSIVFSVFTISFSMVRRLFSAEYSIQSAFSTFF